MDVLGHCKGTGREVEKVLIMTKKDFIGLADALRPLGLTQDQKEGVADWLQQEFPHFMRSRWMGYLNGTCGPGGGELKKKNKPWHFEPDEFEFQSRGFKCKGKRASLGNWCGYVQIPRFHSYYGKHYEELPSIDCHGGLTYSEKEDDGWWIGFDCGHAGIVTGKLGI